MQVPNFISRDVSLAQYSTLGVGGRADFFAAADSLHRFLAVHEFAAKNRLDTLVVGRGSNLLFSDNGFSGLVVKMNMRNLCFDIETDELWADAGMLVSDIVSMGERFGFSGFEPFAGLPGTIGGAVYGNAGCYGREFWDAVGEIKYFDGNNFHQMTAKDALHSYRWSIFKDFPNYIIVSVKLKFKPDISEEVVEETRKIRKLRQANQPSQSSAGCIFKNPPSGGKGAGQLIDECGLKGTAVGGAQISAVHGNFFINLGGAKASDFVELIEIAKGRVYGQTGILLEEEIIKVG